MIQRTNLRALFSTMLATAGATAALGVPVRRLLTAHGTMDVPNERSSHTAPVPRGGGLAGVLAAGIVGATRPPCRHDRRKLLGIAGLATLGFSDDIRGHVPVRLRLFGQLAAGAVCLWRDIVDAPIAALTTAGVVNVVNFMDGINGITGLTAGVWGVNAMLSEDESVETLKLMGALTAGAGLGFLPHNFGASPMFLGDGGSYSLGAAMAAGILSQRSLLGRYRAASPLVLYGVDAAHALVRRKLAGQPLGEPHRDHTYQRLVDRGFAHHHVALLHALCAVVTAGAVRTGKWCAPLTATTCVFYLTAPFWAPNVSAQFR